MIIRVSDSGQNACAPGSSFDGTYPCNPGVTGDPSLCDSAYCDKYLPEREFHARCSATQGSADRCYAEVECGNTCRTGLPSSAFPTGTTVDVVIGDEDTATVREHGGATTTVSYTHLTLPTTPYV